MKKLFMLATAAVMFTGMAFAQDGDKKCKAKKCCKKEAKAGKKVSG